MSGRSASDFSGLFSGALPFCMQRRLGWISPGDPRIVRRALQCALLAWLPAALLAAAESRLFDLSGAGSFAADYAVHARLLVAIPLLVLGERFCAARLDAIAAHFPEGGRIADRDRERFQAAVEMLSRWRDSVAARIVAVVLVYGLVATLLRETATETLPEWHVAQKETGARLSLAGAWHAFVSLPLLLMLLFGWLWRSIRWSRFLWLVSRLDLRLLPVHPDRAAGLRFVALSVRAWIPLAAALGAIVAGTVANEVVHHGLALLRYEYAILGVVGFVVVLCVGPLFLFTPKLFACRFRGMLQYGALADEVGREFEKRWMGPVSRVDESALESPAFSATTDLYGVVANVYQMRVVPLEARSIILLVVATLLPFVPVVLIVAPSLDAILETIARLLV